MNKELYQEILDTFANDILDVIEGVQDDLQPYDVVYRLICNAVSISLTCAPNTLLGIKTIIASVEAGIEEYQDNLEQEDNG